MSNEWPELGYHIAYQTFLELRSGRLFDIMNLQPLSMFFHHLGWFSSFLVCLWLDLNLTCPPNISSLWKWHNALWMTLWLHYLALKASFPPSLSLLIPSYICVESNCYHYLQHTLPDIKAHIFYIFKLKYLISCPTYTIKNSKNGSLSRSTSILACHKCV